MAEENDQNDEGQPQVDYEAKARKMGWSPKDEFRGDPAKWVDAERYVQRGEEFIPFLRAENKKLENELGTTKGQLHQLSTQLRAAQESIDALKQFNSDENIAKAKQQRKDLLRQRVQARTDGDADAEATIDEQLEETNEAIRTAEAAPKTTPRTPAPPQGDDATQKPEFQTFLADNPWFKEEPRKAAVAVQIMKEKNSDPEFIALTPAQRFALVAKETKAYFGMDKPQRGTSKVEGGSNGGSGDAPRGGGNGKSYNDLPPEAKAAADRSAARLVGEGRAFKTRADWNKHYANEYFAD